MPEARYILPEFEERTSYGFKRHNPYTKLFEDRIVFLGVQVDDASADDVMAQLLVLESQDPDRDIVMYINSPGGSFTAMTAIYDTMQLVEPNIQTYCLGQAASMGAVLLSGGSKGKRFALPHSRVMIHQPHGGMGGTALDMEIQVQEILKMKKQLEGIMAHHAGRSAEELSEACERDNFVSPEEAKDFGLIDHIVARVEDGPDAASTEE